MDQSASFIIGVSIAATILLLSRADSCGLSGHGGHSEISDWVAYWSSGNHDKAMLLIVTKNNFAKFWM